MAGVERFEDLEAWKKARELAKQIYRITDTGQFARDYGLRDQIRRAAVSIMSNIAEGFERNGNKEFRQFLAIAKGSTGEVRSQLHIAFDAELITQDTFDSLSRLTVETSRLIGGFLRYLGESDYKGGKFT